MSNEVEEPCVFLEARFKKKNPWYCCYNYCYYEHDIQLYSKYFITCTTYMFFFLVILRRVITFIWLILAVLLSSVEQRSLAQYSTVLYNIIQYSTVKYNTL